MNKRIRIYLVSCVDYVQQATSAVLQSIMHHDQLSIRAPSRSKVSIKQFALCRGLVADFAQFRRAACSSTQDFVRSSYRTHSVYIGGETSQKLVHSFHGPREGGKVHHTNLSRSFFERDSSEDASGI